MTSEQAIEFAKHIEERDKISERSLEIKALQAIVDEAGAGAKIRALKKWLRNAEAFQNAEQPGSATWYPHHLQVAARLAEMVGQ